MLSEKTIENLKILAKRKCWCDKEDFNPMDYSGGNFDDAYSGGCSDGETMMARDILTELGINWHQLEVK